MPVVGGRLIGQLHIGPGVARLLGPRRLVEQGPVAAAEVGLHPELHLVAVPQFEHVLITGLDGGRWRLLQRLAREVPQARADEGLDEGSIPSVQQREIGVEGVRGARPEDAFDFAAVDLGRRIEQRELPDCGPRRQVHRDDVILVVVVERFPVQLHAIVEQPVLVADGISQQLFRHEVRQQPDLGADVEAALEIAGRDVGVEQRLGSQVVVEPHPPIEVMPRRAREVVRNDPRQESGASEGQVGFVVAGGGLGIDRVAKAARDPQVR